MMLSRRSPTLGNHRPAGGSARSRRAGRPARAMAAVAVLGMVATACGGGGGTGSAQAPDATPTTAAGPTALRVAYVPATTVLPLHVAHVQGIFARNNLKVTLEQAANISEVPATLGRQFDIALGTATDLIRAGGAGIDVVQVAGNTVSSAANPFVQVIVSADSGIVDVTGLRGKTIGSPTLSGVIHAGVQFWAKKSGVDPSSIGGVEVPSPNLPDQLKAGRVDAVQALEPFASQLKRDGFVSIGDPFSQIADPLATNFWIAQGAWARANTDAIGRFVASLREAQRFIEQNPADARQVLQGYTGMPAPVAASVPLPTYDFEVRARDLATWVTVLKDIGQFAGTVDPAKLVLAS